MVKIALIGGVSSTLTTLKKMVFHKMEISCVLGYLPKPTEVVSGYIDLEQISKNNHIPFKSFRKINDKENIDYLKSKNIDVIFVVGLSQLVNDEILNLPKLGCIGFHPTLLPRGRGRAPLAWLILEETHGAANFFLMGQGTDDGPIFIQESFEVSSEDDAHTIEGKILKAIDQALDIFLPELKNKRWNPIAQLESDATYYVKRTPDDGWIDWNLNAERIDRIIKASAKPHPKAYTFFNDDLITINNSRIDKDLKIKGVIGRVLRATIDEFLIQCGDGLLWVSNIEREGIHYKPKVGQRLGYYCEKEIYLLKKELKEIKYILDHR